MGKNWKKSKTSSWIQTHKHLIIRETPSSTWPHWVDIQSLAIRTDFWGFSIQNAIFQSCRNLPKCGAKSTIFLSNACMNVGSFSMSFGCKLFCALGISSCWIFYFEFSLLKLHFFVLSKLKTCNWRSTETFELKTHWEASHIHTSIWEKNGGFCTTFR